MKNNIIGLDAGNKNMKQVIDKRENQILMPNVLKNALQKQASNITYFGSQETSPIEKIFVNVQSNSANFGDFYFGKNGQYHGGEVRQLSKPKHNDPDLIRSILATIGYGMFTQGCHEKSNIFLGTCLPIMEFMNKAKQEVFSESLIGTHQISFLDPVFKGFKASFNIKGDYLMVLPEGVAACYNIVMDHEGQYLKEFDDFQDGIYVIVDVGGGTVDITAVMNGQPVEELISYMNEGILYALNKIILRMQSINPEYEVSMADLDSSIREKDCVIRNMGNSWNIKNLVEAELREFSYTVALKVQNLIRVAPSHIRTKVSRIIFTGGTIKLIEEYLKGNFDKSYKLHTSETGLFDNALGAFNVSKMNAAMAPSF